MGWWRGVDDDLGDGWQAAPAQTTTATLAAPLICRAEEEADKRSGHLVGQMPADAAAPAGGGNDDAGSCCICLEPLEADEAVYLPCEHRLHARCCREYLGHQLQRRNDVSCPMCRAPLIDVVTLPV